MAVLLGMQGVDRVVFGPGQGSPGLGLALIASEVTTADKQVRALSQAPKIERRLQLQRKALESMMGGQNIIMGPGL